MLTMKLKLDLHTIYDDSRKIEASLLGVMDEAARKRASEVEIIPGKGSGALKKAVLRFLDRPEIKTRYHRVEKDGDNWGRLFVHFRWERIQEAKHAPDPKETAAFVCFCCEVSSFIPVSADGLRESGPETRLVDCPACGSPNRLTLGVNRRGAVTVTGAPGYEEA